MSSQSSQPAQPAQSQHSRKSPRSPFTMFFNTSVKKGIAVIATALIGAVGWYTSTGDDAPPSASTRAEGMQECGVRELPREAREQISDILTGAEPDHGVHDGKHFGNYEGLLPKENSDYYREYTVTTPGVSHRGARRLVVGGGTEQNPSVWYYSSDHFESFCHIPDASS